MWLPNWIHLRVDTPRQSLVSYFPQYTQDSRYSVAKPTRDAHCRHPALPFWSAQFGFHHSWRRQLCALYTTVFQIDCLKLPEIGPWCSIRTVSILNQVPSTISKKRRNSPAWQNRHKPKKSNKSLRKTKMHPISASLPTNSASPANTQNRMPNEGPSQWTC